MRVLSSKIYCENQLLDIVQESKIYPTSKEFVDLMMKQNESVILKDFRNLYDFYQGNIAKSKLADFLHQNFERDQIVKWEPDDFKDHPDIFNHVRDHNYR